MPSVMFRVPCSRDAASLLGQKMAPKNGYPCMGPIYSFRRAFSGSQRRSACAIDVALVNAIGGQKKAPRHVTGLHISYLQLVSGKLSSTAKNGVPVPPLLPWSI